MSPEEEPEIIKVTYRMNRETVKSLERASEITGMSRTEVAGEAISVYAYLAQRALSGAELLIRHPDGSLYALGYPIFDNLRGDQPEI